MANLTVVLSEVKSIHAEFWGFGSKLDSIDDRLGKMASSITTLETNLSEVKQNVASNTKWTEEAENRIAAAEELMEEKPDRTDQSHEKDHLPGVKSWRLGKSEPEEKLMAVWAPGGRWGQPAAVVIHAGDATALAGLRHQEILHPGEGSSDLSTAETKPGQSGSHLILAVRGSWVCFSIH